MTNFWPWINWKLLFCDLIWEIIMTTRRWTRSVFGRNDDGGGGGDAKKHFNQVMFYVCPIAYCATIATAFWRFRTQCEMRITKGVRRLGVGAAALTMCCRLSSVSSHQTLRLLFYPSTRLSVGRLWDVCINGVKRKIVDSNALFSVKDDLLLIVITSRK